MSLAITVQVFAMLRRCHERFTLAHHRMNRDPSGCWPSRRPEFERPDPLIDSQSYLMSLGLAGSTISTRRTTTARRTRPLVWRSPEADRQHQGGEVD